MSLFPHVQFLLSVAHRDQFPPDVGAEIAIAGRSNAGKSSAINAITERKALARVSKTPGRTRLLNYFELAPGRRIVDLPGYGFAAVTNEERRIWVPLMEGLRERESLRGLLLIVDSRRGVSEEDQELIAWADPARCHVHVLLAKIDKLKRNEASQVLRVARAALDPRVTVQTFSAHDGTGLREAQRMLGALTEKTPVALRPPG